MRKAIILFLWGARKVSFLFYQKKGFLFYHSLRLKFNHTGLELTVHRAIKS